MARTALEEQGYEVVEFDLTEEEMQLGAKFAMGILSNGSSHGVFREIYNKGENM